MTVIIAIVNCTVVELCILYAGPMLLYKLQLIVNARQNSLHGIVVNSKSNMLHSGVTFIVTYLYPSNMHIIYTAVG